MALLDTTNTNLNTLISEAYDAHSNLYELYFYGGPFVNDSGSSTAFRVRTSGFTPPPVKIDSYTVKYITGYVEWPKAKIDVTRNFNLEFRMDANWEVYKKLYDIKESYFQADKSFVNPEINENKFFNIKVSVAKEDNSATDITVTSSLGSYTATELYRFENCWISKIDTPKFNNSSSEPIKVQVTINFQKMYDKQSGYPSINNQNEDEEEEV